MLSSTVAHPYRKTMTPTREAGISICVYRPNQAKYRAIFSPKYFLNETEISNELGLDFQANISDFTIADASVWRGRCSHRTSPMGWYLKKTL